MPREELKQSRQVQVGAAAERRLGVVPVGGALPVRVLELVLNIEQPNANRSREQRRRRPHQQESLPPDQPAQSGREREDSNVGAEHTAAQARTLSASSDSRA